MTWYNPVSWFRTAEAKVEEEIVSVETLALKEVDNVATFLGTSQEKLSGFREKLAADITTRTAALAKVDEQLAKLQSVAPAPATGVSSPSPQPEAAPAPQPEQPAAA
jgi:hypothetical protein